MWKFGEVLDERLIFPKKKDILTQKRFEYLGGESWL